MAKNDQQSTRLPKRIAGVKLPKELRKSGGKLVDALSHPLIADVAAAALMAAAAALRDNDGVRRATGNARNKAGGAAHGLGQGAVNLGAMLADTAIEGARLLKRGQNAPAPKNAKKSKGRSKNK